MITDYPESHPLARAKQSPNELEVAGRSSAMLTPTALAKNKKSAFTIVELLIVIVVIAILAAISIVSYNGVQSRASKISRFSELKSWQQAFDLYQAMNGTYPAMADGGYCLGTNFPNGYGGQPRCRDYSVDSADSYLVSNNTVLMTALSSYAPKGTTTQQPVKGTVGPYAVYAPSVIYLYMITQGSSSTECPDGASFAYTDGAGMLICYLTLQK